VKILILNDYGVLSGGAERVSIDLREGLRERGHDARIFASSAQPFRLALPNQADFTCFGTDAWPQRVLQVANPAAVLGLRRVLAVFRPDVVHVRMFLTQLSPFILPLLARVPALLHAGNHQTICPLNTRILPDGSPCTFQPGTVCYRQGCVSATGLVRTLVQQRAWRRWRGVFRLIVANSEALARTLRANGVEVDAVIRNGTRPVPARPLLQHPPLIACAGRLVPRKGVDDLLRALQLVVPRRPDARLLIVGDGPDRPRIERLVAEYGLKDHVTLCGYLARPRLDAVLGAAWVQVVPSRYLEPFANVVAEAMMRGTVVVATATGGTPEVVRDGVTGFLFAPGNADALAARLISLLDDRSLAERMGQAGREVALAVLTTDRMIDQFQRAYDRVLGSRAAAESG